jgi:hypothetical protein
MQHRVPMLASMTLAVLSLFLTAAKCIENETVSKDPSTGDWVIAGEIHNETEIQGVDMRLRATLLDADGDPIAGTTRSICPSELSPGSLSVFALDFPQTADLPEPADHTVRVETGRALEHPLPKLNLTSSATAVRPAASDFRVNIKYRANQPYDGKVLGVCLAVYNASGQVLSVLPVGVPSLAIPAGVESTFPYGISRDLVPGAATHVRYWLWLTELPPNHFTSDHQAYVSGLIPIQVPQIQPAR